MPSKFSFVLAYVGKVLYLKLYTRDNLPSVRLADCGCNLKGICISRDCQCLSQMIISLWRNRVERTSALERAKCAGQQCLHDISKGRMRCTCHPDESTEHPILQQNCYSSLCMVEDSGLPPHIVVVLV